MGNASITITKDQFEKKIGEAVSKDYLEAYLMNDDPESAACFLSQPGNMKLLSAAASLLVKPITDCFFPEKQ